MAYNPFNIFRRNQKAIFAIITVFIMFTFVLSSGLGGGADFFDWFPNWLSMKNRGEHLCTIDGTKVNDRDLTDLRRNRVMANRFMTLASAQTISNLRTYVRDQVTRVSPEHRPTMQQAANILNLLDDPQSMFFALQFGGQLLGPVDAIIRNPAARDEDKQVARAVMLAFELAQRQMFSQGDYFLNAPNRTTRDLIDFMIWDAKAKQLGIQFSTEDVKALIQKEFANQFRDDTEIRKVLQRDMQGFSLEACLQAIGAEFRVRAAQTALLGPMGESGPLSAPPLFTPPYQLYGFFRDKSSTTNYEVLAVPGAAFASLVTATPSDDELRRLYEQYKNVEPNPTKEDPGFKDPRKVKVEWVEVTGKEPYYQKAAVDAINQGQVLAALVPPTLGPWATVGTAPLAAGDALLRQRYEEDVIRKHRQRLMTDWSGMSLTLRPEWVLDTSVVKARNLAAAAGGVAGSLAGFGGPFLPATLTAGGVIAAENQARIKAAMPLFLGSVPGPGMLATMVGGEAQFRAAVPEPLPYEAYRPELFKTLLETKAHDMAVADLRKLRDEVNKLTKDGKEKNKQPAIDYIAEFVKARGLKTGASKNLESEWTIGDDPGLEPLKAVAQKSPHGNAPIQFGRRFFWTEAAPQAGVSGGPATGTYKPEFYPGEPQPPSPFSTQEKFEPVYLTWRTEEKPAQGQPFQLIKDRVLEAWKRIKGREMAKNEAESLANQIRSGTASSPFQIQMQLQDMREALSKKFPDPKNQAMVKVFKLDNVAPLPVEGAASTPGVPGMGGRPYQLTPSTDIPYPTKDMEKALIDERTKPPRTVLVMPDQPKDTYYVVVLKERLEKSPSEFQALFGTGTVMGANPATQAIRQAHQVEAIRKARDSVFGIVKKELNYVETDEQKKKIEERGRTDSE
jgi:hypothetical protein